MNHPTFTIFSDFFGLKYSVFQDAIFWVSVSWTLSTHRKIKYLLAGGVSTCIGAYLLKFIKMTQTIRFSFPLFQCPCPFLSGLDFLKAGRQLILQMEHSVFSPLLFFIYLLIYTLPQRGREMALPFLEVVTCSWVISYNILYSSLVGQKWFLF